MQLHGCCPCSVNRLILIVVEVIIVNVIVGIVVVIVSI